MIGAERTTKNKITITTNYDNNKYGSAIQQISKPLWNRLTAVLLQQQEMLFGAGSASGDATAMCSLHVT